VLRGIRRDDRRLDPDDGVQQDAILRALDGIGSC
jgi:hypothetical protein